MFILFLYSDILVTCNTAKKLKGIGFRGLSVPLGDIQIEMLGYFRTSIENDDFNKPENHDTHILGLMVLIDGSIFYLYFSLLIKSKNISIKPIVSVLGYDWVSRVQSCCKIFCYSTVHYISITASLHLCVACQTFC